jgi:aryl-phospho-beta-D-glucosidase BglC (GH1 family)
LLSIHKKYNQEENMKRKNFLLQLLLVLVLLSFSAITATGQANACGDVNDDGTTDIVDALLIAQCYVGLTTCPDAAVGDVNCDGQIDIVDALLVAQFYVGIASLDCCDTETPTPTPDTETPTPVPGELIDCSELQEWDAEATYDTEGTQVQYNGNVYSNNWYSIDQNPEENSGPYDVWTLVGQCDPALTSTPSPSPSPTRDPNMTPVPGSDAVEFSRQMGVGWNLGNSMEAIGPGSETAWGNPVVNQTLINAVKAAGFDTLRIPVAWSVFTDEANYTIDTAWLNRVEEVANYGLNVGMYVIINEHWDNGWLNHPFYDQQDSLNNRLGIMWEQIANHFRDYDHRLLFAGTNEVMKEEDWGTPTQEYVDVQNSFNQTFVTTVRATGGNNADRYLVVQAFNTNIDHAVDFAVIPDDTVAGRLFMEVHYYDPYNFTLNTSSSITEWPSTEEDWANEAWCDGQMEKMRINFVDKGVAVILGEYCVASRLSVAGFEESRIRWNRYVTEAAVANFLVPVYWDAGYPTDDNASGLFDRETGEQVHPDIINAIVGAGN